MQVHSMHFKARAGAESALRREEENWLEASSQFDEAAG